MLALLDVIMLALDIFTYVIIGAAIFSWLYAFNVINPRNPVVAMIGNAFYQMTEPFLRPIRRFLPDMGGLDISPIVLLLAIFLVQRILVYYVYPIAI